jgi:geranylgeranyl diphosphate synthase, type II
MTDAEFTHALESVIDRLTMDVPMHLAESIRYSLLAPGKRIRPRLVLACARMTGLSLGAAIPAALAIEMIHCFTLIHDDLPCMDNDDFRRGKPSNHRKFGEATALLAGDSLLALAFEAFADASVRVSADHFICALRRLAWATGPRGVIGGQSAESTLNERSSIDDVRTVHAGKTGALFIASLLVPADLAGVNIETAGGAAIAFYATELGLAFQTVDDLEDAQATSAHTPTSILSHVSAHDAAQTAHSRLTDAMESLASQWGDASKQLNAIANEVLTRLDTWRN